MIKESIIPSRKNILNIVPFYEKRRMDPKEKNFCALNEKQGAELNKRNEFEMASDYVNTAYHR
jgi:hypothetical protein